MGCTANEHWQEYFHDDDVAIDRRRGGQPAQSERVLGWAEKMPRGAGNGELGVRNGHKELG